LAQLLEAYFTSRQLRLSALARGAQSSGHLSQGAYEACYKATQRFLEQVQVEALRQALWRLLPSSTAMKAMNTTNPVTAASAVAAVRPYVLLDITECAAGHYRSGATRSLSHLVCGHAQRWQKDGKTKGFWLMVLGSPYQGRMLHQGRMLPFAFGVFSSRPLGQDASSRNLEHQHLLSELREWVQDRIVVADREFSYEELLRLLVEEQMPFVIRLNTGNKVRLTTTPDRPGCPGETARLALTQGQTKVW
jgi:hypothetical protein